MIKVLRDDRRTKSDNVDDALGLARKVGKTTSVQETGRVSSGGSVEKKGRFVVRVLSTDGPTQGGKAGDGDGDGGKLVRNVA